MEDYVDELVATHEFHGMVLKPNSQRQDQNVSKAEEHDSKVRLEVVEYLQVEYHWSSIFGVENIRISTLMSGRVTV